MVSEVAIPQEKETILCKHNMQESWKNGVTSKKLYDTNETNANEKENFWGNQLLIDRKSPTMFVEQNADHSSSSLCYVARHLAVKHAVYE